MTTRLPYLTWSGRTGWAEAGDQGTQSEALRHLGIASHAAGRLDTARDQLEESSRLRQETGNYPGVAANMIGLAYIAAAQNRHVDAIAALDEAQAIAQTHEAHAIVRHIEHARTAM